MNLDFDALKTEKQEIMDFLGRPDAYADPNFAAKNRRLNELDELISLGQKRDQLKNDIIEADSDPDLAEMKPDLEKELQETEAKRFVPVPAVTRRASLLATSSACILATPKLMASKLSSSPSLSMTPVALKR